ncbi:MAG: contractile injection system protein, VgrG/Pvc8 family, partial [Pseudomonadota bacterium]
MKPAWRIDIDGGAAGALLSRQLASIVVHDEAGFEADSISFTVSNENGRIAAPRRGVVLSAHLGFEESGLEHIGDFTVDYVAAHGPVQTLEIGGAAVDLRTGAKAPKTRAWRDQTLHDIAETIAGEHGLTARVTADLGGVRYPHLSQTGESDLHFLTRLSDELGAIAKVAEGVLVIAWRGRGQTV